MAKISKITYGFVIQTFDTKTNKCTKQEFVAGDQVDWEDGIGEPIEANLDCEYQPFVMEQPDNDTVNQMIDH